MIVCTLINLPSDRDKEFRKWLSSPHLRTLLEILEAQENKHWCDAYADALKADPDNLKLDAANQSLLSSQRYKALADLLVTLRDRTPDQPHQISKVTTQP